MSQMSIVAHGDGAAVVLPTEVLASMGLHIGDAIEVIAGDRQFILRQVEQSGRQATLEAMTKEIFERRRDAYQRLA